MRNCRDQKDSPFHVQGVIRACCRILRWPLAQCNLPPSWGKLSSTILRSTLRLNSREHICCLGVRSLVLLSIAGRYRQLAPNLCRDRCQCRHSINTSASPQRFSDLPYVPVYTPHYQQITSGNYRCALYVRYDNIGGENTMDMTGVMGLIGAVELCTPASCHFHSIMQGSRYGPPTPPPKVFKSKEPEIPWLSIRLHVVLVNKRTWPCLSTCWTWNPSRVKKLPRRPLGG